ncbi:hypothetical protein AB0P32_03290 [Streptomyces sp. NPDC085995]|uniref:hypothetical protein n=1 Tax=Streptomyces sp. NPDC085995 TaxID=3154861 RepID=UPI00342A0E33
MKKARLDPIALTFVAIGWIFITGVFLVAGILISDAVYEPGEQTFLGPLSLAVGALVGFAWAWRRTRKAQRV